MSLKSKLILWPTLIAVGAVAFFGFMSNDVARKGFDEVVVNLSVTVLPNTHVTPMKIEYRLNAQRATKDTSLNSWTNRVVARRGDLVFLTSEQFEATPMTCVIQVPGHKPVSNTTSRAEKITCATTVL